MSSPRPIIENQPALHSCSAATRVVEIVEIREIISQYLNLQQRALCSMVSRAWHDEFSPTLHVSLDLSTEPDILQGASTAKLPSVESIQRNGAIMENLTVCLPSSYTRVLLSTVRHLQSLAVLRSAASCTPQNGPAEVRLLLEYNPSLQRLKLDRFQGPAIATTLKEIGQTCRQLKHLSFVQSNISLTRLAETMIDAPRLTNLFIDRCTMDSINQSISQPLFPHLEHLEVVNSGNHVPLLVPQSRVSLQLWEVDRSKESATFRLYPKLKTLIVRGQLKKGGRLPKLLIQCPELTEFTLYGSPFLKEAFISLTRRLDMLTKLDFLEANPSSRSICDDILWSCSKLVYLGYPCYGDQFDVGYVPAAAANAGSKDWSCSGLKTLKFKQLVWSRRVSWNERALEQLSNLSELQLFEVGTMHSKPDQLVQKWPQLERFDCMKSGQSS